MRSDEVVRLELRNRVKLLDISQSGAILACEAQLPIGTRGYLRTELASLPFSAEAAVTRHVKAGPRGEVALGTQFGSSDDRSRQHLDHFLRKGKN